jgi:hypothetical protein
MLSFLATATLAVGVLASAPQPPQWRSDYGDALEATRQGNQPLLVVIDNPRDDQTRIDRDLLSENATGGNELELLESYELCHVDASTKYGREVAKAFRTQSYPYMAIIDKTGSVILYSKAGEIGAEDWQQALSRHQSGERGSVRTVSHLSYQPSQPVIMERPMSGPYINNSYCPSCQRSPM